LFFSTDPTFYADLAVNCVGLSKTVIDRRAQRVQWNFSLAVPFRTRNLSAVQPTGATEFNPLRAKIHCCLHGFLHRASISDAALNLQRDVFGNQLRVDLRRLDFLDVNLHLFAVGHLGNFFRHLLDFRALASDHNSRTRSVNGYANGIPRPLDHNFRDCRKLQLLLHVVANLQIIVQKRGEFLRRSVPARAPVAIHVQAEADWINFLSHIFIVIVSWSSEPALASLIFDPARSRHPVSLRRQPLSLPLSFPLAASLSALPSSRWRSRPKARCECDWCASRSGWRCREH